MKRLINQILYFFMSQKCANIERTFSCNKADIKSILVFSNTALGDFLFNTPTIKAIRIKYPNAKIILVGNPKNQDFISEYPHVDEIIYWRNKYRNFISTCLRIREKKIDVALLLHSHSPQDIFISWLSGCRVIIKDRAEQKHTHLLHGYSLQTEEHCIQRRLDLAHQYLGSSQSNIEMEIPFQSVASNVDFDTNRYNVALQLGASKTFHLQHF